MLDGFKSWWAGVNRVRLMELLSLGKASSTHEAAALLAWEECATQYAIAKFKHERDMAELRQELERVKRVNGD